MTTKKIEMHDNVPLDNVRRTSDGYLAAEARVARTGIQLYTGDEVGRPDMEFCRVYRPEQEVFSASSLKSYAHRPMTNDHPPEMVSDKNWKKYAVGHTGDDVVRDGDFVRVPLVLMDAGVISDYESGKRQLSLGYTTALDFKPGVTKDGQEYDAIQTQIRANHLAVVTAARGGPNLRIGDDTKDPAIKDQKKETKQMSEVKMKIMTVDGLPVQIGDDTSATIVERHITALTKARDAATTALAEVQKQLDAANVALAASQAETKKANETKDAEIDVLKKQVADAAITPARLDQLVKDRAEVIGKAKSILGDKLVVDGKTIADIRKQVVDAKMGDAAKTYSEDAVSAAFNALTVGIKAADAADPLADAISFQIDNVNMTAVDKAYEEQNKYLKDAWRNPVQQ